jgi:hypothetical protein
MPEIDDKKNDPEFPLDMLYGMFSLVSQFGGVLRERGQEYRNSSAGKVLGTQIEKIYRGVDEREKGILDVIMTSLDGLARAMRDLDESVNKANGHDAPNRNDTRE